MRNFFFVIFEMSWDLIFQKILSHDTQRFQSYISHQAKMYNLVIIWTEEIGGWQTYFNMRDQNGDLKSTDEIFKFLLSQKDVTNTIKMNVFVDRIGCGVPQELLYFSFITIMETD